MTSSARRVTALTASIVATMPASVADADGLPAGSGLDAAPVSAPGGSVEYYTRSARRTSVVVARSLADGEVLRRTRLPGDYAVPAVAYDSSPSGLSADGRTLVLINPRKRFPRARTTFAILDAKRLRLRRVLTLRGDFSFDALSPDGKLMYLINYLSARDQTRYRVRAYDLRERRLLPKPIVDPSEPPDEMNGLPITRATSPDGRWAYTLYDGKEHPFIHALDTERKRAVCIDLDLGKRGVFNLRLDVPPDGSPMTVVTVHRRPRTLASIDTRTFRVTEPGARPRTPGEPAGREGGTPWLLLAIGSAALLFAAALREAGRRRRRRRAPSPGWLADLDGSSAAADALEREQPKPEATGRR